MDIISAFDKAQTEGKQTALATVVHVEGSSYRREGARMLIAEDGELTGAISGGCLEGDALRKALFVMQEKKAKLVVYDTINEDDVEVGFQLGCNGIIQVLIEPINTNESNHPIFILKEAFQKINVPRFVEVTRSTAPSLLRSVAVICDPAPERLWINSGTN